MKEEEVIMGYHAEKAHKKLCKDIPRSRRNSKRK